MKTEKKQEARRLREEGKSVREIALNLSVAKSSVSRWVRSISLTSVQKERLTDRSEHGRKMACKKRSSTCRQKRIEYQDEGREMAMRGDSLFIAGCMLYWAEGSKEQASIGFCNSDEQIMMFFVNFLRKCFGVRSSDISMRLKFYSGNGVSFDDAIRHWLDVLGLPSSSIRKSQVDNIRKDGYGKKKGKRPYGVCYIQVSRNDLLQKILGAIQQIAEFNRDEWLLPRRI